jgi:hypothetical protein
MPSLLGCGDGINPCPRDAGKLKALRNGRF